MNKLVKKEFQQIVKETKGVYNSFNPMEKSDEKVTKFLKTIERCLKGV